MDKLKLNASERFKLFPGSIGSGHPVYMIKNILYLLKTTSDPILVISPEEFIYETARSSAWEGTQEKDPRMNRVTYYKSGNHMVDIEQVPTLIMKYWQDAFKKQIHIFIDSSYLSLEEVEQLISALDLLAAERERMRLYLSLPICSLYKIDLNRVDMVLTGIGEYLSNCSSSQEDFFFQACGISDDHEKQRNLSECGQFEYCICSHGNISTPMHMEFFCELPAQGIRKCQRKPKRKKELMKEV